MKRIFSGWIPALFIFMAALTLGGPVKAASESDKEDLLRQLEALESRYLRYEIRADRIKADKAGLEEYFLLLEDVKSLEREIERLEDKLAKAGDDQDPALPEFEVHGFLEQIGGDPISPYAGNGDIVAFSAAVEHPAFKGDGKPSEIFFQLYDSSDRPVSGVFKRHKALEAGTRKTYTFRFRLDQMPQGQYRVGATHYLLEKPDVKTQASATFKVFDAAVLDGIVVTDRPNGSPHQNFITNEKLPHIYVFYKLAQGIESAEVTLEVADGKHKLAAMTQERGADKRYFGIRLEKGSFKPEQDLVVTASVRTPDGKVKTARSSFSVGYYRLVLHAPRVLESGKTAGFRLEVPDTFIPPFSVSLKPSEGVVVHHSEGDLNGTVTGVGKQYDTSVWLSAGVRDSRGHLAKGAVSLNLKAHPQKVAPSVKKQAFSPDCGSLSRIVTSINFTPGTVRMRPLQCNAVEWKIEQQDRYYTKYQVKKGTNIKNGQFLDYTVDDKGTRRLFEEAWYLDGKLSGPKYEYRMYDGRMVMNDIGQYKDGRRHGKYWIFASNGQLTAYGSCVNDTCKTDWIK